MPTDKITVRVREGFRYGTRNQYSTGTILRVDEVALRSFADKLERVPDSYLDAPVPQSQVKPQPSENEGPPDIESVVSSDQAMTLKIDGYDTPEVIAAASDDELLAVDGVGPAALAKLRDAYGSAAQ